MFWIYLNVILNQWKAAKEELLEDEEESEDTYESLERKRQREIEVCRNLINTGHIDCGKDMQRDSWFLT